MSAVFKALGHPVRREIVAMLRSGPLTSGEIAAGFEMSWPSVSGHLRALRDAELVECERAGTSVRYRLNISAVEEAVGFLHGILGSVVAAPNGDVGLAPGGST
jgi:DNA-binding transcriptional ArsR family regulator